MGVRFSPLPLLSGIGLRSLVGSKGQCEQWCSTCRKFLDPDKFGLTNKRGYTRSVKYRRNECRKARGWMGSATAPAPHILRSGLLPV